MIFQVAGLSGAGAIEEACAAPGVIGIGVDVDQSKSLPQSAKCILSSAEEEAGRRRRRRRSERSAPRPTSGAPPSGMPRPTPVGRRPVAVRQRLQGPRHSGDPGQDRRGPGRHEGLARSIHASRRLRQEGLTRRQLASEAHERAGIASARSRYPTHRCTSPTGDHDDRVRTGPRDARDHQAVPGRRSPTTRSISTCARGEIHALLGENGAGKSTPR